MPAAFSLEVVYSKGSFCMYLGVEDGEIIKTTAGRNLLSPLNLHKGKKYEDLNIDLDLCLILQLEI